MHLVMPLALFGCIGVAPFASHFPSLFTAFAFIYLSIFFSLCKLPTAGVRVIYKYCPQTHSLYGSHHYIIWSDFWLDTASGRYRVFESFPCSPH
ncbi:hypothetical protein B0H11DRAFT_1288072 [Mycena galericulata]|nr:hypothetical protein B0H11DRAFT_1288072 [Mycena galericulata]